MLHLRRILVGPRDEVCRVNASRKVQRSVVGFDVVYAIDSHGEVTKYGITAIIDLVSRIHQCRDIACAVLPDP